VHVDVDVASKKYADCGNTVLTWAGDNNWGKLPCAMSCPPVSDTVDALVETIESWLGLVTLGDRTVLCLPAQSSGTWLAAAVLPLGDACLADGECDPMIEDNLARLPKGQREYRNHAPQITEQWSQVIQLCTQAASFEQTVLTALMPPAQ
jgi:hypothetical protein